MWLLDPASFGKTIRNTKLVALRKAIKLLRSVEEGDSRLNEPIRVLEEITKSYDHIIRRSPTAQIVSPKEFGNIEEKSRLYVAGCVAAVLWPTRNRFAVMVEQLERRGEKRESKAVEMQVRRFRNAPGAQPEQIVERQYLNFKLSTNWARLYPRTKDEADWSKHAVEVTQQFSAISEFESRLLQRVIQAD